MHDELDPGHVRPHDLGPRPRVPHRRRRPARAHDARRPPRASCATRTAARSASSTCTSRTPTSSAGSSDRSRASTAPLDQRRAAPHPRAAQRGRGVREVPRHQVRRHRSGSASRAPSRRSRSSTRSCRSAADAGLDWRVLGMAHRGRLNVLANIVGKSYDQIFKEFEGYVDPTSVQGSGDVKYHLGATGKYVSPAGADIKRRAGRQPEPPRDRRPDRGRHGAGQAGPASSRPGRIPVLPLLIHGDAAFAGQGVVAECLAMSDINGLPRRRHRSTSSSTTRSASRPRPSSPARRCTAPTWPRWCRRRSST